MEKVYLGKLIGLLYLAACWTAGAAFAEAPPKEEPDALSATIDLASVELVPGLRAFLDPETGELRVPTMEEAQEAFGEQDEGSPRRLAPVDFWVEEREDGLLILHVDPGSFDPGQGPPEDADGALRPDPLAPPSSPPTAQGEVER